MPKIRLSHKTMKYGYQKGWVLEDHPILNHNYIDSEQAFLDGRMAAHDILEHINGYKNIGTVEDELQALGAICFVRLDSSVDTITEYGLASDVSNNLSYTMHRKLDITPTNHSSNDFDFDYIIQKATLLIYESNPFYGTKEEMYQQKLNIKYNLQNAIHLLRTGYRKARKKYKESFMAGNLFYRIKNALDNECPTAFNSYELSYTISTGEVKLTKLSDSDEDPYVY